MSDETETLPGLLDAVSENTTMTYGELATIGAALLGNVVAVGRMGWASPGSSLDYTDDDCDMPAKIIRDFIVWTSGRTAMSPLAEARLRSFVVLIGWQDHMEAELDKALNAASNTS